MEAVTTLIIPPGGSPISNCSACCPLSTRTVLILQGPLAFHRLEQFLPLPSAPTIRRMRSTLWCWCNGDSLWTTISPTRPWWKARRSRELCAARMGRWSLRGEDTESAYRSPFQTTTTCTAGSVRSVWSSSDQSPPVDLPVTSGPGSRSTRSPHG